ncbi:MAG: sugar ABC transporter permease [Phototrophicaceae bacterium]
MRYHKITPYLFIAPMLIGLVLFRLGPIIAALFISFTKWNVRTDPEFVGLANYQEMFASETFWMVLGNTLLFAIVYVPSVIILALIMALLVNQKLRGIAVYRALFFMPYITSMVAVAMVWNWIFSTRFGVLNNVLRELFNTPNVSWLTEYPLWVLIIVTVWKTSGFQMMIYVAGLQGIPSYLYEAAKIDGATRWQQFRHITIPLLTPITFFVLIFSIIEAFRTFEVTFSMTGGGPLNQSTTLAYYIYQNAFVFNRMGYASSLAYMLMFIVGVITVLNFYGRRRWVIKDTY